MSGKEREERIPGPRPESFRKGNFKNVSSFVTTTSRLGIRARSDQQYMHITFPTEKGILLLEMYLPG